MNFNREELYERVWTAPMIKLAAEFGISDVALKKTCKRLNVPTPSRGYWAKIEAGLKPKKTPLPRLPIAEAAKDLAAQEAQRLHSMSPSSPEAKTRPTRNKLVRVSIPEDNRSLHPVARELKTAVLAEKQNEKGLMRIYQRIDVPSVEVSKDSVDALVRSFHAILSELESRGVEFRRFRGKYGHPSFHCGKHQLQISITETIDTVKREPTEKEKRRPSWEWNLTSQKPSGRFIFEFSGSNSYYSRSPKVSITQKPGVTLEEITAQVIESIWDHFVSEEKQSLEAAERRERENAEYEIRQQKERAARHETSLRNVQRKRQENLLRAAQWWSLEDTTKRFIDECERKWRATGSALLPDQEQWLLWAREQLSEFSPESINYPDPAIDGPFDPATVPFGGPYPSTRDIPRPPTMPAPPTPAAETQHHSYSYNSPKPYPFWLKHPR